VRVSSVWLVEKGDYSDYHIIAIFSTQSQADEFVSHHKEASVREWELNTWTEEKTTFEFVFDLSGNLVKEEEHAYIKDEDHDGNPRDLDVRAHSQSDRTGTLDNVKIYVNRGPRELALKIASERYTKIRAYLDEAQERTVLAADVDGLAEYRKVCGAHNLSVSVAEVLAGIVPVPDPPKCGYDYEHWPPDC
jgi:hypothetical protein